MTIVEQIAASNKMTTQQKRDKYEERVAQRGFKSVAEYEKARERSNRKLFEADARELARGKTIQAAFELEREQDRQIRERSERNRTSPFRPIIDVLVKAGDLAVKSGVTGAIGELYKKTAPPGSEFYQKGSLEQKLKGATDIIAQPVQKAVEERVKKAVGL